MSTLPVNQSTFTRSKHDKQNPYVMINREMFHDRSISPAAKGVLGYLLTLPNDWIVIHSHLEKAMDIGEHALNTIILELIKAGYAKRSRQKIKGRFTPYNYEISENKIFLPDGVFQPGSSSPKKPDIQSIEPPLEVSKETTTKKTAVVVPSSKKSKGNAKLSEVEQLLYDEGLEAASINSISKLNPTVDEVKASLELAKRSSYASLGAWLHQCIKLKWWASKSKSKASEAEEAKSKQQANIDARRQKAIKLLKKYPGIFEMQENAIMISTAKGLHFMGYASEEIEQYFQHLLREKGEK